ncbi:MAG: DUF459 domain-containing protein [Acidimicrobiales bacterium]
MTGRLVLAFGAAVAFSLAASGVSVADVVAPEPEAGLVAEDPTRYWPDPVSDIAALGAEERFYWLARSDHASVLESPSLGDPLRIWVGGDSLSGGPAWGVEAKVENDARYELVQDIRKSTGVITEWYFDWRAYVRDEIAPAGFDVVVLSMGGNDAQRFRGFPELVGSVEWSAQYSARVAEMIRFLDAPGRVVIWVGMPAVKPPQIAGLPQIVNPLAAEVTSRYRRAFYVDAMNIVSPGNQFVLSMADVDGVERRVRVDDGVHYTVAGGRLVAVDIFSIIDANTAAVVG